MHIGATIFLSHTPLLGERMSIPHPPHTNPLLTPPIVHSISPTFFDLESGDIPAISLTHLHTRLTSLTWLGRNEYKHARQQPLNSPFYHTLNTFKFSTVAVCLHAALHLHQCQSHSCAVQSNLKRSNTVLSYREVSRGPSHKCLQQIYTFLMSYSTIIARGYENDA